MKLLESGRLFPSFLSSPPARRSDLEILAEAQALYDGQFAADPDYWKAACFEDGHHNQVRTSCPYPLKDLDVPVVCNMTLLTTRGTETVVHRSEGEQPWELTRWQPASRKGLTLFNHKTAVALLKEMGIERINIIGDSMSR